VTIQVVCDNCRVVLRNEPDEANAGNADWKPDVHATLKLHVTQGNMDARPIDMDLCLKCAKRYLKVLKEPV
jgi:hypothetical protein